MANDPYGLESIEWELDDLKSVDRLAADSDGALTTGSLRWQVFNAASNGLDPAIKRINGKVRIILPRYLRWVELHGARARVAA